MYVCSVTTTQQFIPDTYPNLLWRSTWSINWNSFVNFYYSLNRRTILSRTWHETSTFMFKVPFEIVIYRDHAVAYLNKMCKRHFAKFLRTSCDRGRSKDSKQEQDTLDERWRFVESRFANRLQRVLDSEKISTRTIFYVTFLYTVNIEWNVFFSCFPGYLIMKV